VLGVDKSSFNLFYLFALIGVYILDGRVLNDGKQLI